MPDTTKDQFIAAATGLFAERGFYGVSIAAIAEELSLTKQALLHHFGSKERLYGEALKALGAGLIEFIDELEEAHPAERFKAIVMGLAEGGPFGGDAQRLVIRELMDNRARLGDAETWYLKPFLDRLIEAYQAIPGLADVDDMKALAAIYNLIGAVSYFEISQGTLEHMYGPRAAERLSRAHPAALEALIASATAR